MTSGFNFFKLASPNSSTQEKIIAILSDKWPLSAKEIHLRVVKESGKEVTYQAIHKSISELEEENILTRTGNGYELNQMWLYNLKEFVNETVNKYSDSQGKYEVSPDFEGTVKFKFNDYNVFCVTVADIVSKKVLTGKGPDFAGAFMRHLYWPLTFNFRDFLVFKRMPKNVEDLIAIVKFGSPLDNWLQKQWALGGWRQVKIGTKHQFDQDVGCQGESTIKISFSDETKEILDSIYEKNSGLGSLFMDFARNKMLSRKIHMTVTFEKDKEMANFVRNQLIEAYNGGSSK